MLKEKVRIKKTVTLNSFQGLIRGYRIKCGMTGKISITVKICLLFVLCSFIAKAQLSTGELPVSFGFADEMFRTNSEKLRTMPPIDLEALRIEDEECTDCLWRYGYSHEVNFNLENSGQWFNLPNGDRIWKLEIYCPNALSIDLCYDKFWLPEGAKLFIYSDDKRQTMGAFTSRNNKLTKEGEVRGFATGFTYSDKVVLEYYLPRDATEQGIISICNVIQGYRNARTFINSVKGKGENSFQSGNRSDSCQVSINCPEGVAWQNEKNAIALIKAYTSFCSGALLNTTANDCRPYFFTAAHCLLFGANNSVGDAINNPYLDHFLFIWHYEDDGCYNTPHDSGIGILNSLLISGAVVIANSWYRSKSNQDYIDFALLHLDEDPKESSGISPNYYYLGNRTGITPYYLGWDATGNPGVGGVGIHHPQSDYKKIATYSEVPESFDWRKRPPDSHWKIFVHPTESGFSFLEGGSSGSPLINSDRKVIGALKSAWEATCQFIDSLHWFFYYYGKFSVAWDDNDTLQRQLKHWLDPLNTGRKVINGLHDTCCGKRKSIRMEYANRYIHLPTDILFTDTIFTFNTCDIGAISHDTIYFKSGYSEICLPHNNFEYFVQTDFGIYFPSELSGLLTADFYINDSLVKKGIDVIHNWGYFFRLAQYEEIWNNPTYNSEYIVVKAKLLDGTEYIFKMRIYYNYPTVSEIINHFDFLGIEYNLKGNIATIQISDKGHQEISLPIINGCYPEVFLDRSIYYDDEIFKTPPYMDTEGVLHFELQEDFCDEIELPIVYRCGCPSRFVLKILPDCYDPCAEIATMLDFGMPTDLPFWGYYDIYKYLHINSNKPIIGIELDSFYFAISADPECCLAGTTVKLDTLENDYGRISIGIGCACCDRQVCPTCRAVMQNLALNYCILFEDGSKCCETEHIEFWCAYAEMKIFGSVTPNPGDAPTIAISYNLSELTTDNLKIDIHDQLGNRVLTVMDAVSVVLSETITVNISSLLTGTYYTIFQYGDFITSVPFIKQ